MIKIYRHAAGALYLGLLASIQLVADAAYHGNKPVVSNLSKIASTSRSYGYSPVVQTYATYYQPYPVHYPAATYESSNSENLPIPIVTQQAHPSVHSQTPAPLIGWTRKQGYSAPQATTKPAYASLSLFNKTPRITQIFELVEPEFHVVQNKLSTNNKFTSKEQKTTITFNGVKKSFGPLGDKVHQPYFYVEEFSVQRPIKQPLAAEHPFQEFSSPIKSKLQSLVGSALSKSQGVTTLNVGSDDLNLANLVPNAVGSVSGLGKTVDQVANADSLSVALDAVRSNLGSISPIGDISTTGGSPASNFNDASSVLDKLITPELLNVLINKLQGKVSGLTGPSSDLGRTTFPDSTSNVLDNVLRNQQQIQGVESKVGSSSPSVGPLTGATTNIVSGASSQIVNLLPAINGQGISEGQSAASDPDFSGVVDSPPPGSSGTIKNLLRGPLIHGVGSAESATQNAAPLSGSVDDIPPGTSDSLDDFSLKANSAVGLGLQSGARTEVNPLNKIASSTMNQIAALADGFIPGSSSLVEKASPVVNTIVNGMTGNFDSIQGLNNIADLEKLLNPEMKAKLKMRTKFAAQKPAPAVKSSYGSADLLKQFLTGFEKEMPGLTNLEKLTKGLPTQASASFSGSSVNFSAGSESNNQASASSVGVATPDQKSQVESLNEVLDDAEEVPLGARNMSGKKFAPPTTVTPKLKDDDY